MKLACVLLVSLVAVAVADSFELYQSDNGQDAYTFGEESSSPSQYYSNRRRSSGRQQAGWTG